MNFDTDVSHYNQYKDMIGKTVYLSEDRCFYKADKYQYSYKPYSISHYTGLFPCVHKGKGKIPDVYSPIEILPKGKPLKILKAMNENASGFIWSHVIGKVYSKKLTKEVEFEYHLGFAHKPDPMPWNLEKPK
ncbi:MAG: hypothetical protein V4629_14080 [Pseudomonadota bacterium]